MTSNTIAAWRVALEAGDADAAGACLAEDALFISPLTEKFRFHGRQQITDVLRSAVETFDDVRFHTEVADGPTYALFLHCRVGAQAVEEAQLLRLDEAGLIRELTFFGRPLPALTATMVGLGPRMLRRQGRPGLGRLIGAAVRPLNAMTRLGEQRIVPLADPNRVRDSAG
ncbi:nuclear transport factor 2 family protein [Asanoa sp. WMMD1127]|uniref:nuclear transport factor 2 family protein n=1 Tax=Asanoa sp. WMMD1127 TaxID=3016107 RepID=UPI002417FECA|nr:nuclear transport factor 2 family protein [Asanoa sp. WMMD1127]MDG4823990.1 nuclear transport factor 2 family protein [Asanoa sp. WMMD1127]